MITHEVFPNLNPSRNIIERLNYMSRYKVKFQWQGETKYGIVVDDYNDEVPEGYLLVEDGVTSQRYIVEDNKSVIDILFSVGGSEYDKFVNTEFEKTLKISDGLPEGLVVGKLFSIGVADGKAWYLVTKVNKKTCHIEWRGFCSDRYFDRHFGYGGKFDIKEVSRCTGWDDTLKKMFSKKSSR